MAQKELPLTESNLMQAREAGHVIAPVDNGYVGVWPKEVIPLEKYSELAFGWAEALVKMEHYIQIVDAGCGPSTGSLALFMHIISERRKAGRGTAAWMIDRDWQALKQTEVNLSAVGTDIHSSPEWNLRMADIQDWERQGKSLVPEQVDGLFMRNVFHWLSGQCSLLTNMRFRGRPVVLRPGAFLYIDTITHFNGIVLQKRSASNGAKFELSDKGERLIKIGPEAYEGDHWYPTIDGRTHSGTIMGNDGRVIDTYQVHSFSPHDLRYTLSRAGYEVVKTETYYNPDYTGMPPELFPGLERQPENVQVMARARTDQEEKLYTNERFAKYHPGSVTGIDRL